MAKKKAGAVRDTQLEEFERKDLGADIRASGVTLKRAPKATHTPGPWRQGRIAKHGHPIRIIAGDQTVAIIPEDDTLETKTGHIVEYVSKEGEANALLVAASPDLLMVLKQIVATGGLVGANLDNALAVARAAIAKAEGRGE